MTEYENLAQQLQAARLAAGKTQNEAAQILGCTAQAVSNWERGYTRIDCLSLFRLLASYGADLYDFLDKCGVSAAVPEPDRTVVPDARLAEIWNSLGPGDREKLRRIAAILAEAEEGEPARPARARTRVIPLYRDLAAAGHPSPNPGEDYDEYLVAADSPADFAVRISGDSMEPWIRNGEVVLARRRLDLKDGDVGIFYARDGMVCKQYCQDSQGNTYLFSLNRQRRDADITIPATSDLPLICFGRVLLERRIPLPVD